MPIPAMFNVDGSGASNHWNYSNKEKDDYATKITGDVVAFRAPQKINYTTKQPECWPNGEPKLNVAMIIKTADGQEKQWVFGPGGKGKRTNAYQAVVDAIKAYGKPGKSLMEIGGLNITVATKEPPEGFGYSITNQRPFKVRINGAGEAEFRGFEEVNPPILQPQDDDLADDEIEF